MKPRDQPMFDCVLQIQFKLAFIACQRYADTCPEQNQTSPKRTSSSRIEDSTVSERMVESEDTKETSETTMKQRSPTLIGSRAMNHSAPPERLLFDAHQSCCFTYGGGGGGRGESGYTRDLDPHLPKVICQPTHNCCFKSKSAPLQPRMMTSQTMMQTGTRKRDSFENEIFATKTL